MIQYSTHNKFSKFSDKFFDVDQFIVYVYSNDLFHNFCVTLANSSKDFVPLYDSDRVNILLLFLSTETYCVNGDKFHFYLYLYSFISFKSHFYFINILYSQLTFQFNILRIDTHQGCS